MCEREGGSAQLSGMQLGRSSPDCAARHSTGKGTRSQTKVLGRDAECSGLCRLKSDYLRFGGTARAICDSMVVIVNALQQTFWVGRLCSRPAFPVTIRR